MTTHFNYRCEHLINLEFGIVDLEFGIADLEFIIFRVGKNSFRLNSLD